MRAIGNNLIIKKIEEPNQETKGGLLLTEKQREDVRFQQAKVIDVGESVVAVKKI
jgi:co-chaperonin GroES (HSP10)